ncbi:MAG: 2-C-methyl-D-erythritol 4-phosphate cytidylyltransferase [Rubrivivax sp.]|nr:2-C-methyl-D-erythritol 4-phosphate cytidylyltransferase [Rubrivivax sp.]
MPAAARCFALVPCAGIGERAQAGGRKQYAVIGGRSVVAHTLAALAAVREIEAVLVVLAREDQEFERHASAFTGTRSWVGRCGGASRAATVANGLAELRARGVGEADWVLVHDAARCLLRPAWVQALIAACRDDAVGGLLAVPLPDTLKAAAHEAGAAPRVAATVPRHDKWLAQTPQMFRLGLLQRALATAGHEVSDEASAVEALGLAPLLVPGHAENFKLTWPADFELAARLLETRR